MSINGDAISYAGLDAADHQPAYVYLPVAVENGLERPSKRRKVIKGAKPSTYLQDHSQKTRFEPLLNGREHINSVRERHDLFEQTWSATNAQIESILDAANENTLEEVASFVQSASSTEPVQQVPVGFIVTGPNIASQSLLFKQLGTKLKSEVDGPVVVLRSGDASNLKAVLKQVIRDAASQRSIENGDESLYLQQDGRKLLNYDLAVLHNYVKSHDNKHVVVALQDSEAFDSSLLGDLIQLFTSWMDRIPFRILFGVATSVDLFQERLSRAATHCLYGSQFNVEKTSSVLERIFQKVVAGVQAQVRLGPNLVSSLMERQDDHVQSVHAFTTALKYAYMTHFYGNPLSVLNQASASPEDLRRFLQHEHFEAIRLLPSFKTQVHDYLAAKDIRHVRGLLQDDDILLIEIWKALNLKQKTCTRLIRMLHVILHASSLPIPAIELYIAAFAGTLKNSDIVRGIIDSIKKVTPEGLVLFIKGIVEAVKTGDTNLDLDGWKDEEADLLVKITDIRRQTQRLADTVSTPGKEIRSGYAIHNQGVRATVVSQRVQLSYEKSTLSKQDQDFTSLVDRTITIFEEYFTFENPQDVLLNEIWLYDSLSPYKDVFVPRPRFAVERALAAPRDYLNCDCCNPSIEGLSSTQPATATLYQLYLETGSLINIFDLWSAFYSIIGGEDGQDCEERAALMLFYRALADLKSLSMVKTSKKKLDHVAKVSWKGL